MTEEINEDATTDFTDEVKARLMQKGLVFEQLLQSEKFTQFFAFNYDLAREEESKALYLIEVPDDVVAERMAAVMKAQVSNAPTIVGATPADQAKLIHDIKSGK